MSKTLDKDFVTDPDLTPVTGPTLTCTRALDTATQVNSSGVIETVSANTGRFNYNPVTLVGEGLLIEEGTSNLCPYNEDFSNGWIATNGTLAADTADTTAPDGTNNADKYTDNATNSHHIIGHRVFATNQPSTHTLSVYAKAGTHDYVQVHAYSNDAESCSRVFDLSDGTIGESNQQGSNLTLTNSLIEDAGNGWYRCSIVFDNGVGITSVRPHVQFAEAKTGNTFGTDGNSAYSGSGTTLYVWGVEVKEQSLLSSYIGPVTTVAVARNADVVSVADVTWMGTGTTLYTKFNSGTLGAAKTVWSLHDTTANERVALEIDAAGEIHFIGVDGGVTQWDISTTIVADTDYEIATAFAANDAVMYIDGTLIGTDAGSTLPTVTTVNLGSDHADAEQLNSTIAKVVGYDERLSNDLLDPISSGNFPVFDTAHAGAGGTVLLPQGWMWSR